MQRQERVTSEDLEVAGAEATQMGLSCWGGGLCMAI
jgi:hypothetical protein